MIRPSTYRGGPWATGVLLLALCVPAAAQQPPSPPMPPAPPGPDIEIVARKGKAGRYVAVRALTGGTR